MTQFIRVILFFLATLIGSSAYAAEDNGAMLFRLSYNDAEKAISDALVQEKAGEKLSASINGRNKAPLFSYHAPVQAKITGLRFDNTTKKWSANLLLTSGEEVISAMPLDGRYEEMMEVAVLKRQLRRGDIIAAEDVEMQLYPVSRIKGDAVTDASTIIGQSPMRSISPLRPIRQHEVVGPTVIRKNALVKMHYQTGSLNITTSGIAQENGAIGDIISVRNVSSNKLVRARVENSETVTVSAPKPLITPAAAQLPAPQEESNHAFN